MKSYNIPAAAFFSGTLPLLDGEFDADAQIVENFRLLQTSDVLMYDEEEDAADE